MKIDILVKAIEKAKENGYMPGVEVSLIIESHRSAFDDRIEFANIIFSHPFAKALWGEKYITEHDGWYEDEHVSSDDIDKEDDGCPQVPAWRYHLERMVMAEEPLKYLEDYA